MRSYALLLMLLGCVPTSLAAQEDVRFAAAVPSELTMLVEDVLSTTPRLQVARARLEAIETAVTRARAAGLPNISISGSAVTAAGKYNPGASGQALFDQLLKGQDGSAGAPISDLGATNSRLAQISITQQLFSGLRIKNGITEARATVTAARADYSKTRQSLAMEIAEAYLSFRTAEGRRDVAQKSVDLLHREVRGAQLIFETGQGTKTDMALAQAQLASAQARLAGASAEVTAERGRFAAFAGSGVVPVIGSIAPLKVPSDVEQAVVTAMNENPNVIAARAIAAADEAALRGAKGERAPSLLLRGALGYSENQNFAGDSGNNASLTAELSVPLYSGGSIGANIAEARATVRASRYNVTDTERQIEMQVRTAFATYAAAELAESAAGAQVSAIELAYRGVLLEREVGQRTILDVLRVEESLLDARSALLDARRNTVIASFRCRLAIGDLLE